MADNLRIFGITYSSATGIKATDDGDVVRSFIRPQGTLGVSENGLVDVTQYASVDVDVAGGGGGTAKIVDTTDVAGGTIRAITTEDEVYLQGGKTVTPSTSSQTITPDTGYDGFESVVVASVPTQSKTVNPSTASQTVTPDGSSFLSAVTVNSVVTQSKTATPTTASQTITPDAGAFLSAVKVEPIPGGYIIPSGTLSVNQNGVYDAASYASVDVSVAGGGGESKPVILWQFEGKSTGRDGDNPFIAYDLENKISIGSEIYISGSYGYENSGAIYDGGAFQEALVWDGQSHTYTYSSGSRTFTLDILPSGFQGRNSLDSLTIADFGVVSYVYDPEIINMYQGRFSSVVYNSVTTYITDYICSGEQNIQEVSFPNVIKIGNNVFRECGNLASISFPNAEMIGEYAFASCSSLSEANMPNVTSISNYAFINCISLESISFPLLESAGAGCFRSTAVVEANFPYLKTITSHLFSDCNNLITFSAPNASTIGNYAFCNCKSLVGINAPNITTMAPYAFQNCLKLSEVNFPSATYISAYAFLNCVDLTEASFPMASVVGTQAFSSCAKLTAVYLESAKTIASYAFYNCVLLTTISIPNISVIASSAFIGCSSLQTISFPLLSNLSAYAFSGCSRLTSLYLLNSVVATGGTGMFTSTPISLSTYLGYYGSIYVRESLLTEWQSKLYWSTYSARMVGLTDAQIAALGGN